MTTLTNIRQEILQEINKLSAPQLTEVLQFINKISITDHKNGDQSIEKNEKKRRAGIMNHDLILVSKDQAFDNYSITKLWE